MKKKKCHFMNFLTRIELCELKKQKTKTHLTQMIVKLNVNHKMKNSRYPATCPHEKNTPYEWSVKQLIITLIISVSC